MFALPIFTVGAIYRHAVGTVRWTVPGVITPCRIKKNQAEAWFFVFALPIFTARAIYRPAVRGCPVDTHRQKKASTFL